MLASIRWRIALPYAALILLAMAVLALYLTRVVRQAEEEHLRQMLVQQAEFLAAQAAQDWAGAESGDLDELAVAWADSGQARITLVNLSGDLLGESHPGSQEGDLLGTPEMAQAGRGATSSAIRYEREQGIDLLYMATPVTNEDGAVIGIARIGIPLDRLDEQLISIRGPLFTTAVITALIAILMAVIIAERITLPVRRLTAVAQRMTAGDLDARLLVSSQDEVGQLTQAFNDLGAQIRKQVDRLDTERERLVTILENMADGVIITDEHGQVLLINPAAQSMLEVEAEALPGSSFAQVARHYRIIEVWQRGRETGQKQTEAIEIYPQQPRKEALFLQIIVTPLNNTLLEVAQRQAYLIILQNLTPVRRLETVRRDFISNISHELRTPLASLKAVVETLRDGAIEDPQAAERFLNRADEEVDALAQMVNELLELSRIESGRVPFRFSPTTIYQIVEPAVTRLQPQADRNGVSLILDLPRHLPPVLVDGQRVQQVVVNLVHNGIKFTPAGGSITISAQESEGAIVVEVTDTGYGIPAADLPRIFERFYKADRARSSGGTGLGLAIARHIVQGHGGRIWARSREGQGSTFYFSLPIAEAQEEAVPR
jgi:two-component system phosphate regulon sensor histidine kinase PhoR